MGLIRDIRKCGGGGDGVCMRERETNFWELQRSLKLVVLHLGLKIF